MSRFTKAVDVTATPFDAATSLFWLAKIVEEKRSAMNRTTISLNIDLSIQRPQISGA
jgi:hypothetical protein